MLGLIDAELAGRPGPVGLPVRTVLVGLLLSLHYHHSATLADACRVLLDELTPTAQNWLGVSDRDLHDPHARIAFSQRVYRTFNRLTSTLDPHRCDRRSRLPFEMAAEHAAAWEDTDAEHLRRRSLLQEISDRLVQVTVRLALKRGLFKGWKGDIGVDTTAIPAWHHPPSTRRDRASIEVTAGWHFSAGSTEGVFGHSATLLVAASRRHPTGHPREGRRVSSHPQLALGFVLDTPGKRIGPNAIHALKALTPLGLPTGVLAADRAYTDQTTAHFAQPARQLGYQLALDYKQEHRGIQGTHLGALLVDGTLACPAMPTAYAHATTGMDDKAVREPDDHLLQLLAKREPFFLKLKQAADARGAIRLQCPAAGTAPTVTCPRFQRLHRAPAAKPKAVDLTSLRATAAHTAAKPIVPVEPAKRLRPLPQDELPRICQKPTITIHPGDLGQREKFRQDFRYLSGPWQDVYKPIRANNEGLNGRAKSHRINLTDASKRLAHGRVAQTILIALMICTINLQILHDWHLTTGAPPHSTDNHPGPGSHHIAPVQPANSGIPPPR
ncbi:hypothetical protein [Streptomyces orinoci]|uniref:Transposase n=1 Tax=Streptomyces orinoci TaxID=67339 RepID=A0ABV3K095_STRON|nr:hypothetical protein [Streptomyces orinoci]